MKDTVYIPFVLSQLDFMDNHFKSLIEHIRNFITPDGVEITDVVQVEDTFIFQLLEQLKELNPVDQKDIDSLWDSPEYLICIEFETEEQIHFNLMPWLEEQLVSTIEQHEEYYGLGFIYFYLVNDGKEFRSRNIAKVDRGNGIEIILDQNRDDISFMQEAAPFLAHYWYRSEENIAEAFPAETAKYLLLFNF